MSYLVLARKYRSRQFEELVGQKHVATTLLNAFRQEKLGQAYLFTGTRGVGKTSVARIFAKALRCEDPDSQPGGKNRGRSCDKCPSCIEINNGTSLDVLEIDGASNNGVENVREIREQVKFLPSRGKVKVYIIDEVHMLSTAAFNALLKTLEEPPSHVTFMLATTEAQKIPATILSRCQRFDFKRVPQPLIFEHLMKLAKLEGIDADVDALQMVAHKAEGSMRDALSSLDQCLAMAGKKLTAEIAAEALGVVSSAFLLQLLKHVYNQDLVGAAELVKSAYHTGVEMKQIAVGLAETLRSALLVKHRAGASLLEMSPASAQEYETLFAEVSAETIQAGFRAVVTSIDEISRSPLPRASMEMTLAKLIAIGRLKSLDEILSSTSAAASAPAPMASAPLITAPKPGFTEKKSPAPDGPTLRAPQASAPASTAVPAPMAAPSDHSPKTFQGYLRMVAEKRSSLSALLEHAIALTPDDEWHTANPIVLGFRKNHSFYHLQAQHKTNFELLEKALLEYVGRKAQLKLEALPEQTGQQSLVEKKQNSQSQKAEEKKSKFLAHEIVRNTKEIFGAELATIDIDKS